MQNLPLLRPDLLQFTPEQFSVLRPFFAPIIGALVSIVAGVAPGKVMRSLAGWLVLLSLIAGGLGSVLQFGEPSVVLFNGMMVVDDYTRLFNVIFSMCGIFTVLSSNRYLESENLKYNEYHLLVLFSVIGMMWMTAAIEMITLFIGLEIMSLAVYTLVGFRRADRRSNEAAIKYFVLGAAASAILLYGTALLYGATGTTQIRLVLEAIQSRPELMSPLFIIASGLIVVGFLFKVAAVPFHMWMPDVYEGAPSPITGFMTTGIKAASFAIFVRVLLGLGFGKAMSDQIQANFQSVLWIIAVLTMVVGNVIALTQTNLKRMLAYSSIAHTGYLLVGIIAAVGSPQSYFPVVMYLISYVAVNMGAFAVLTMISKKMDTGLNLHDLSGLAKKHPALGFAMAVFMFSMAGIPPTGGFLAKYFMFYAAVQSGEILLTVIAVLCSAVSVYYYLRVLVYMYMREPIESGISENRFSLGSWVTVVVSLILILQLGLLPSGIMNIAKRAVTGF